MIDDFYIEGLKEAVNIGSGHGATALSRLLGRDVLIKVPSVHTGPKDTIIALVGSDLLGITFTFSLMGDIGGNVIFMLPASSADRVLTMMSPQENMKPSEPMGESALKEMANIISASFLSAMANFMNLIFFQSIPEMEEQTVTQALDLIMTRIADKSDWILSVSVELKINGPDNVPCSLFFIPERASVERMFGKLETLIS